MKSASVRRLQRLDRRATHQFGIPSLLLMENAGIACEQEINKRYPKARQIVIVCGQGNNGGDGFVLARRLWNTGKKVMVFHFGRSKSVSPDASLNLNILNKLKVRCVDLSTTSAKNIFLRSLKNADVVVDAIFGTGLKRIVDGPYRSAILAINRSQKKVVSIDVPSGIHADSGRVLGDAIKADLCVTFVMSKLGFRRARAYTGRVIVRDISVPERR